MPCATVYRVANRVSGTRRVPSVVSNNRQATAHGGAGYYSGYERLRVVRAVSYSAPITIVTSLISWPGLVSRPDFMMSWPS